MKIDLDYMAQLLNAFVESDRAFISFDDFAKAGIELNEADSKEVSHKLMAHLHYALDCQLIGKETGPAYTLEDIGIKRFMSEGYQWIPGTQIRLTSNGYDFQKALSNTEVLERLKTEFKDAPFKAIFEGGQKLLEHAFKKKIDNLLSE